MNKARNDVRLSTLPEIGTDIRVHSQSGFKTYSYGRISSDGESITIDVIKKYREPRQFPAIAKTVVLDLDEIVRISFRNINGKRISLTGDSNYWLKGFPKSGESSVLVICREEGRTVDISNGWLAYSHDKVIISEIVEVTKKKRVTDIHERHISEVVMALVSDDEETVICVRTTETK